MHLRHCNCTIALPVAPPHTICRSSLTRCYAPKHHAQACVVAAAQVLMDYQDQRSVGQPSAQTANLTAHAEYTINNASCIFLSMWMPDILPQDAAKYSVALYTSGQFTDAVFDLDASQPYNLTFCTGATCNATAGTWVKQYGLSPGHTYFVVGSYDWSVTKTNALQRSYAYVQAFTAGEPHSFWLSSAQQRCMRHLGTLSSMLLMLKSSQMCPKHIRSEAGGPYSVGSRG